MLTLILVLPRRMRGLLYALLAGVAAMAANPHRVLLVHTYHPGYSWTAHVHEAVVSRLQAAEPGVEIRTEYLDWKHYPQEAMLDLAARTFQAKYADVPLDLVLTSDNRALEFVLAHRKDLFRGVPVVFCGYNGFRPEVLHGETGVTGVEEQVDIRGTLSLALRLHPGIRRLRVVCDESETGRILRQELGAVLPTLGSLPPVVFSGAEPADDLVRSLQAEPPSTLILVCLFAKDGHGRFLDLWELPQRLKAGGTQAPVWALFEESLGHGILGGSLQGGHRHGEVAAGLALRILRGEPAQAIPVIQTPTVTTVFDHRELARFGIPTTALPPEARVAFAPESFYTRHRRLVLGALGLSVASLLGLGALLVWRTARERAVRRHVEHLRGLVQHLPMLTLALDAGGQFALWNGACESVTGQSREALQAMENGLAHLMPDAEVRKAFLALAASEGDQELPLRGRDGDFRIVRWFSEANHFPMPGWAGWMVGVDVTDRRQAEAARRRLALAMGQSGDGILLTDAEDRIIEANPAVAQLLDRPERDIQGARLADLLGPIAGEAWGTRRPNCVWTGRLRTQGAAGARVLEVSLLPIWEEGKPTGVAALLHDRTEQQGLEEQIARTQRMESLGTLAAGVAHDFRNLMSVVLGSASMLGDLVAGMPEADTQLGRLEAAARRGVDLVQQLLGFARNKPVSVVPVSITALLEELSSLVRHGLPFGIRLITVPGPEGLLVKGDAGQLLQVLMNLVLNARDALPDGGTIQVAASARGDQVCLEVTDDGVGMTPEVLARVFEPMFTTKPPGVGTGMGLAMVYSLVRSHGGQVDVESGPGQGTRFRVRLPRASESLKAS